MNLFRRGQARAARLESQWARRRLTKAHARTVSALPPGAWSEYDGLLPTSVALVGARGIPDAPRTVHLVLPGLHAGAIFAGMRTALVAAAGLASRLDLGLRVVTFGAVPSARVQSEVRGLIADGDRLPGHRITFVTGWALSGTTFSSEDPWIATYWNTAHALDVAGRSGIVDPAKVVYLIQDYEPDFYANSTESAIAESTYRAGFRPLVNSRPLSSYIEQRTGMAIPPENVFRPDLDLDQLTLSASQRDRTGALRVAFYGRPSKPRNSFALGVSTLRSARKLLPDDTEFVSWGEGHRPMPLGAGAVLRSRGKLTWNSYFEALAGADVLLSLQQTPHPSHPPLDAVAAGGWAVTNDMHGTRADLSPRLLAVTGDPTTLGRAVAEAAHASRSGCQMTEMDEAFVGSLGRPLELALDAMASAFA